MKPIQLTTLTAALLYSICSPAQSLPLVTNGLVAYYPFNGNANDASGNGNNGIAANVTPTQDRFGVTGMAYQFNGSNSSITCNISNIPTGSNARTVALWAKTQPTPTKGVGLLFWGANANTDGFGIIQNSSPYTWQGQSVGGGDDVNSGVVVDTNWHYIVVSYNSPNLSIYVDGVLTGTLGIAINTAFSAVTIGASASIPPFTGAINEVRIYNRALSTNEISELYQSFVAGIVALPSIIITGNLSEIYSIQYVTNLSSTNWTTLVSNIVLQGNNPYLYPDTNAINQPQRFYRVLAQ